MPSLKPVKKENLSVRVYNEIRNALINGQYEPGERLIIGELAQEMGVSITPVREPSSGSSASRAWRCRPPPRSTCPM